MERLLRLHVLVPIDDDNRWDEVMDLVNDCGFGIFDEQTLLDKPPFGWNDEGQRVQMNTQSETATGLFEEREDNLAAVDEVEDQLAELYPEGAVFRHERNRSSRFGRSLGQPSAQIILTVANLNVDHPKIRWRQEHKMLDTAPRTDDDRVFHSTKEGVFALDGATGEVLWERNFDAVSQVPAVHDGLVVAAGRWSLNAYDAATGESRWSLTLDDLEENVIESRVEIGPDKVYIGTRGGDVLAISEDGTYTTAVTVEAPVTKIWKTRNEFVIHTINGHIQVVDADGTVRWESDQPLDVGAISEDRIYTSTDSLAEGVSLSDGAQLWKSEPQITKEVIDRNVEDRDSDGNNEKIRYRQLGRTSEEDEDPPTVERQVAVRPNGPLVELGDRLVFPTKHGIYCVNSETGDRIWRYTPSEEESTSEFQSVVSLPGNILVGVDQEDTLHSLRAEDGTLISTYSLGDVKYPLAALDQAVVTTTENGFICLDDFPDPE